MSKKGPWQTYGYKRKRAIQKWYERYGAEHNCWLCGLPIEGKINFDHVLGQKLYPEYAFDISNLRPAHLYCNQHRKSYSPTLAPSTQANITKGGDV